MDLFTIQNKLPIKSTLWLVFQLAGSFKIHDHVTLREKKLRLLRDMHIEKQPPEVFYTKTVLKIQRKTPVSFFS